MAAVPALEAGSMQVASLAAAITAVAVVVVLLGSGDGLRAGQSPPVSGGAAFDPSVDGPGILTSPPADQLGSILRVVAGVAVVFIGLLAWRRSRSVKIAASIAAVFALAAAYVVTSQPGLAFGTFGDIGMVWYQTIGQFG